MYDRPEEWEEWIEDLVGDEADDEDAEFAEYDDEAARTRRASTRPRARGRRRPPVRHAPPRGRYGSNVKGQTHGTIETPQGRAEVKLPGPVVTVPELTGTVDTIQKDMKANADGIRDLAARQREDVATLTAMINKNDRRLSRGLQKTQLSTIIGASVPLLVRLLQQRLSTPPAPAPAPAPEP